MISAALVIATTLIATTTPNLDPACETAKEAIEIAQEHPFYRRHKEVFGDKAVLLHGFFATESNVAFDPTHALIVEFKNGWGAVLFCKGGDWLGDVVEPLAWRKALNIVGEKGVRK